MPTYPNISGPGLLVKAFDQLRKSFPAKVDASYLKRFQIAPSNESYVIGILRFLGLIDDEGNKRDDQVQFFFGNDQAFESGLEATLRTAYAELLSEMGEGAFGASREDLTHWFRGADKTSELIGKRQASTFLALAALAGHASPATSATAAPRARAASPARTARPKRPQAEKTVDQKITSEVPPPAIGQPPAAVGLTVRIEVNLPAGGDAQTYDAIFASIKRHLMP